MGSYIYEKIINAIKIRGRTLINENDQDDLIVEDDSVLISLRHNCDDKEKCKAQLILPKVKKSLMAIDLDKDHNLLHKPSCAHCGKKMQKVPELKITLGFQKKIYGVDKLSRHHKIRQDFLSIK